MILRPIDCLRRIEDANRGPVSIGSDLINSRFWDRSLEAQVEPESEARGNYIARQLFLSNLGAFTRVLESHPSSTDTRVSTQLDFLKELIAQCSENPEIEINDNLRNALQELIVYISELEPVTISPEQLQPQYEGEEGARLQSLSREAFDYLEQLDPGSLSRQLAEQTVSKAVDTLTKLNKQNSRVTIKPNNFHIIWIKNNSGIKENPIPQTSYTYKIFTSEDAIREAEEVIHTAFLRAMAFLNADLASIPGIVIHGHSDFVPERNSKLGIRLNHRVVEHLLKAIVGDNLEMKMLASQDLESCLVNEIVYELKHQKSTSSLFGLGKDIGAHSTQIVYGGMVNPVKFEDFNLSINSRGYVTNSYYTGLEHSLRLVYRELLEFGFTEDDIRDYRPRSLIGAIEQLKLEPEGQRIMSAIASRILSARDEELIERAREVNSPSVSLMERKDNGVEIFVDPILTSPGMVTKLLDLDTRAKQKRVHLSQEVAFLLQDGNHPMHERAADILRTAEDIANQEFVIPVDNEGKKMSVEKYVADRKAREIRERPSRRSFPPYYEFTPDFIRDRKQALKFLNVKGVLGFDSANVLVQDYLINTNHAYGLLIERTNVS